MPSRKYIPNDRGFAWITVVCLIACTFALQLFTRAPAYAADAADPTALGIRVTDSSSEGSQGDAGVVGTSLGIRITDSAHPKPLTVNVTFDTNGGEGGSMVVIDYGSTVTEPPEPTRDGYVFQGWYLEREGGSSFDFSSPVYEDTVLYAQWSVKISCTIPSTATVEVDALGNTKAADIVIESSTIKPVVVSTVTSEMLTGASAVFGDAAVNNVSVVLSQTASPANKVTIPLKASEGVPVDFRIEKNGKLPITFDLKYPKNLPLSYFTDEQPVVKLIYEIKLAP